MKLLRKIFWKARRMRSAYYRPPFAEGYQCAIRLSPYRFFAMKHNIFKKLFAFWVADVTHWRAATWECIYSLKTIVERRSRQWAPLLSKAISFFFPSSKIYKPFLYIITDLLSIIIRCATLGSTVNWHSTF